MIKIDNHKIEYFLLNYMIALQTVLIQKNPWGGGVKMDDFLRTMEKYPESVLPYYRKQRSYLSQAISRNEIDAKAGITKKLFLRVARGFYVLNQELEVLINEDWVNVNDLMGTEKIEKFDQDKHIQITREKMFEKFPELRDLFK